MRTIRNQRGFALPVIMLVSLSLMIIALTMLQSSSSVRGTIDDQYYDRLASEAAQAGVTAAVSCLASNTFTQTWTAPMTEQQDCNNLTVSPAVKLSSQPNVRSSYSIGDTEGASDGALLVVSTGTVQRLADGTSTAVKTYTKTLKRIANSGYVKFSGVTIGYYGFGGTNGTGGAYYAIRGSDGRIRVAGANYYGQLGNGGVTDVVTPQILNLPDGKKPAYAYANFLSQGQNLYIKTTDNLVYAMGEGNAGQLGNGKFDDVNATPAPFQLPPGEQALYVGTLGRAAYVLTKSNNVYAAGDCTAGELGVGNADCGSQNGIATPTRVLLPTPDVTDPNTIPAQNIIGDSTTTYIRMKGGRVYGLGGNYQGQMCDGTKDNDSKFPKKIWRFGDTGYPAAKQVDFDGVSVYITDTAGKLWVCGDNTNGQLALGPGAPSYVTTPQQVPIPNGATVKQVATDQWHILVLASDGTVYAAGYNNVGQLGNGTTGDRFPSLSVFPLPPGVSGKWVYVSSLGPNYGGRENDSFVVGSDGKVYGAGSNYYGQLGNGSQYQSAVSSPVTMNTFDGKVLRASSAITGYGSTYIFTTKGKYYTVGNNSYGQLGTGDTQNTQTPAEAKFLQSASSSFVF